MNMKIVDVSIILDFIIAGGNFLISLIEFVEYGRNTNGTIWLAIGVVWLIKAIIKMRSIYKKKRFDEEMEK